jgi:hypothetical protein
MRRPVVLFVNSDRPAEGVLCRRTRVPARSASHVTLADVPVPRLAALLASLVFASATPDASAQAGTSDRQEGALAASDAPGAAQSPGKEDAARPQSRDGWHGLVELKRQNTARGTEEEKTNTSLRLETFFDGPVQAFRLDLPFPDDNSSFGGSPFNPRLGDIKTRLKFRPLEASGYTFPSFVEMIWPTADPASLGAGKYQLLEGIRMIAPVTLLLLDPATHKSRFEVEVEQANSVAGDPTRNDINYTKLELTLYDVWRKTYTLKLKLKPVQDWVKDANGAVAEVEGGRFFAGNWRAWLMLGERVWGPAGVQTTYSSRIEVGVARTF